MAAEAEAETVTVGEAVTAEAETVKVGEAVTVGAGGGDGRSGRR